MGRIICCVCGKVIQSNVAGLDGDSHGYCDKCLKVVNAEVDAWQREELKRQAQQAKKGNR